jgi:hypothetical protein
LTEGNSVLIKVDSDCKLNVFHKYNILLPLRTEGYWDVYNELEEIKNQGEMNIGKIVVHAQELVIISGIAAFALGAAAGVGAITKSLCVGSILNIGVGSILNILSSGVHNQHQSMFMLLT